MADESNIAQAPVHVYDISTPTPQLGTLAPSEVHDAVASGNFSFPQGASVPVLGPDGSLGTVDAAEAKEALNNGYRYATPDIQKEVKYSTPEQEAKAGLEGAASAATFGLSTGLERMAGVDPADIQARRDVNPGINALGQVAGIIADPLGATTAMETLGIKAAKALGREGISAEAIKGLVSNALFSGGDETSKLISGDPAQSVASAISNVGLSGMIGAGTGTVFGAANKLWEATHSAQAGEVAQATKNQISKIASEDRPIPNFPSPVEIAPEIVQAVSPKGAQAGADFVNGIIRQGVKNQLSASGIAEGVGGAIGLAVGHPWIGSIIGKKALTPILESVMPALTKPILDATEASGPGLKAAVDYGHAVMQGVNAVKSASSAVFNAGEKVLPQHSFTVSDSNKLQERLDEIQKNPQIMAQVGGNIGHYLPAHQQALSQSVSNTVNYLNSQKPKSVQQSPLDTVIEPHELQKSAFKNTLEIAENPLSVLRKVKEGSVKPKDLQDLNAMYPGAQQALTTNLAVEMSKHLGSGKQIPYETKMGLSMFFTHPLDSTFIPTNIQAAQAAFRPPQQQQPGKTPTQSASKALEKLPNLSETPNQARSAARSNPRGK
jgi:hypothetical protein